MDAQTLVRAQPGLTLERAQQLIRGCNAAMIAGQINTVNRAAMFMAQLGAESSSLRATTEYADGSEYEGRVIGLGNNQPGDGPRFKGRGFIQLTGRLNYGAFSDWAQRKGLVKDAHHFVNHPEEVAGDYWAWMASVWYWTVARNINPLCDAGDILGVTRAINGGLNGLDNRTNRWKACLKLGTALLPEGEDDMPFTDKEAGINWAHPIGELLPDKKHTDVGSAAQALHDARQAAVAARNAAKACQNMLTEMKKSLDAFMEANARSRAE